ncbi:hypothetical protein Mal35_16490 [Gimesia maris]|nr:hypothetical protein Mal35_16490 [Gimesia maris]
MQRCGLFTSEREGRWNYYQVAKPLLQKIMNYFESLVLSFVKRNLPFLPVSVDSSRYHEW